MEIAIPKENKALENRVAATPETVKKFSARWQPNRSIACWYIWKNQKITSIG